MQKINANEKIMLAGVQHFSLHDGPGVRTVLFFKGCPLRCLWCCNPESQSRSKELRYAAAICLGLGQCGRCLGQCPQEAIYVAGNNLIGIDRDLCQACGACAKVCPSQALAVLGQEYSLSEILELIARDGDLLRQQGGITLSGGEPLMFPRACVLLLNILKQQGIHTVIATCGFFDLDDPYVIASLKLTDLLLYDLKHHDALRHRQGTSLENARILQNLGQLGEKLPHLPIITRTPVIAGFNDNIGDMTAIARLLKPLPTLLRHELLAYFPLGEQKYLDLGRPLLFSIRGQQRLRPLLEPFWELGLEAELI